MGAHQVQDGSAYETLHTLQCMLALVYGGFGRRGIRAPGGGLAGGNLYTQGGSLWRARVRVGSGRRGVRSEGFAKCSLQTRPLLRFRRP